MRAKLFAAVVFAGVVAATAAAYTGALGVLFSSNYLPHRFCYLAQPGLIWTNVAADTLIAGSYVALFLSLAWAVAKLRGIPELRRYLWVFGSFGAFILACGMTHMMETVTVWWPIYRFSAAIKILCALVSVPTAILFAGNVSYLTKGIRGILDLIANEQRKSRMLRESEEFLARTGRIAGIGGWEVDLINKEVTWSAETHRLHRAPPEYKPTVEEGLRMFAEEGRPTLIAALLTASAGGPGWDLELPLIRFDGQRIWVRTVGEVDIRNGKPVRLLGAFQDITAQVAIRDALRQANERVALATENGGIGIFDWDIRQDLCTADPWMHRLYGLEPPGHATPLKYWCAPMHSEDRDRVILALEDAVADRRPYNTEFRVVWLDGSVHHIRAIGRVTRDEFGAAAHMIGVNWDVTESRQLLAELATQRDLLRVTLQSICDGVITTDLDRNVSWLNPVAERITGWATAEAHGKPLTTIFETLNAETREPIDNPVANFSAQGAVVGLARETLLVSRDGTEYGIENQAAPIRDGKGEIIGNILGFRDVTEERRLSAELAAQHELMRVTLQSIGDGVITKDADRRVLWMNTVAERMTGWSNAEALRRSIDEVFCAVDEETRLPVKMIFTDLSDRNSTATAVQPAVLIARNGKERYIESSASPLGNSGGTLRGNIVVFRDLTEVRLRAAETEQVARLQLEIKTKDQLLSHVSHELRSPLTSIYSFTSIIADGLAGGTTAEQKEYLQIVLKNVVQLQSMIEDLLTVAQNREGKLSIELQSVVPANAIGDAVQTMRSAASTKQIELSAIDPPELPNASADPTRLRQVLIILLDNAIKFTPSGGSVSVAASIREPGFLLFEVADTGCGIPEEKRNRIFENLYQIMGPSAPDTSQQGRIGLGLGLHIARNLVTRQGGHIWVTDNPGGGSIFQFTLPIFSDQGIADDPAAGTPRRRKTDKQIVEETVEEEDRSGLLPAA